jgi:DNA-binding MarR family transcriptional regulator
MQIISIDIISTEVKSMDRTRNLGFLIKDIGRLYTRLFESQAGHLALSLAECKVLTYLTRHAGVNQVQLAELTGMEPMSLVRILDRMEADGLIERRQHPTDRRARQLYLKDKAQPALDQLWKVSDQVRALVLSGIKAEDRQWLIGLLEQIHGNLLGLAHSAGTGKAEATKQRGGRETVVQKPRSQRTKS